MNFKNEKEVKKNNHSLVHTCKKKKKRLQLSYGIISRNLIYEQLEFPKAKRIEEEKIFKEITC